MNFVIGFEMRNIGVLPTKGMTDNNSRKPIGNSSRRTTGYQYILGSHEQSVTGQR